MDRTLTRNCRISTIRIVKKPLQIAATCLFVLSFPLLLISSNLRFEIGSERLYSYSFDQYDVEEEIGVPEPDLKRGARAMIDYFNGSRDSPQVTVTRFDQESDLYQQREIEHLRDVKSLIRMFYAIQWITLGYAVAFMAAGFLLLRRAFLKPLSQAVLFGAVLTLGLLAFLGVWAAIDFDSLFLLFHQLGFSNDLWQLNTAIYDLPDMYPEGFFMVAALLLVGVTVLEAVLLGGAAWVYHRRISGKAQIRWPWFR